ncbi:hypothetical protein ACFLZQ_07065 [Thermodesulfobacteriota bacterium]
MTQNQIEETGSVSVEKESYLKLQLVLQPKQELPFAVQDLSGNQTYFAIDVIHLNPSEKGRGNPEINWKINLQWWDGYDGTEAWRKVVTITNRSRSEQSIEFLIKQLV